MKRRSFIKKTTFTSIPLLLKGIPVVASSDLLSQSLEKMALAALNCDRHHLYWRYVAPPVACRALIRRHVGLDETAFAA